MGTSELSEKADEMLMRKGGGEGGGEGGREEEKVNRNGMATHKLYSESLHAKLRLMLQ